MTGTQPPLPPIPDPQRGIAPIQGQVVPSYAPAPPVNGLAVASLVLGIVSLACSQCITAIPGVILGHVALKQIRESRSRQGGHGLAIGGLVTGYISLGIVVVVALVYAVIILVAVFGAAVAHAG